MRTVRLKLKGPFRWCSPEAGTSFFDQPEALLSGFYLWSIAIKRKNVVGGFGITRATFRSRLMFHTRSYFDGRYAVYDYPLLKQGRRRDVWDGFWWDQDAWKKRSRPYHNRMPIIALHAGPLLNSFRIYVAPLPARKRTHERIEAAVYDLLRSDPARAGLLVEDGMQVSRRWPGEQPFQVTLISPVSFLGLPPRFLA